MSSSLDLFTLDGKTALVTGGSIGIGRGADDNHRPARISIN